jgi:hypothetical protein
MGCRPKINLLSYTPNGSINDPSNPHGLSLIHRVSDTPIPKGILRYHRPHKAALARTAPFLYYPKCKAHRNATTHLIQHSIPSSITLVHSYCVILVGAWPKSERLPNYACFPPLVSAKLPLPFDAASKQIAITQIWATIGQSQRSAVFQRKAWWV